MRAATMKPSTSCGGGNAVALLGEAPQLATYLASLKAQEVAVVVEERLDDRSVALVRQLRRPIVILGNGIGSDTKTLVALSELRSAGAIIVIAHERFEEFQAVASNHLLPWADTAWFVPEIYRLFGVTASARIHSARTMLAATNIGREWLARALVVCPCKANIAARTLGMSRTGLDRRMTYYGHTWHALCDQLTREVYTHLARLGNTKQQAIAEELECRTATELSRRLSRLGISKRQHERG